MIDCYSWNTPNGQKVHIMLQECGLEHRIRPVNIFNDEQFSPDFLAISPNNKIPAIVDSAGPSGAPFSLFESGAILRYLADKSGLLGGVDAQERYTVDAWLLFQVGGVGPMFGQANYFREYASEKIPFAINRYANEAKRLCGVMERRLQVSPFLGGATYSIADIASFTWVRNWAENVGPIADYPDLERWYESIGAREAVQRGLAALQDAA